MTEIQSLMLSVCFGAVVGMLVGNLIGIIQFAIEGYKEKERERKESNPIDQKNK